MGAAMLKLPACNQKGRLDRIAFPLNNPDVVPNLTAMAEHTLSRHEKSLGLLTTKFVSLLQEAKDGVLDLKVVSTFRRF